MKKGLIVAIALVASIVSNAQIKITKLWETDTILSVPESVIAHAANKVLYVSNIDGTDPWAKDGHGNISKVGLDGKVIDTEWITGLNAPKGMGIYENKLYVADLDQVVVIDIAKGAITQKIMVAGAVGLNDITIDKNGVVYVSDMKAKKIFTIAKGVAKEFMSGLKNPNGLLMHHNIFYVLDDGAMYKMEKNKSLTKIADGMEGGTDGIENYSANAFIVSCWAGTIWYVGTDGTKSLILDTRNIKSNTADIGYDAKTKILYVPTFWHKSVAAYQLQ